MSRLLILPMLGAIMALCASFGYAAAADGARGAPAKTYLVQIGDEVHVLGTPIACRLVHVRTFGRRVGFDCRRGGPLEGTYGTLLTAREAAVVRFDSARTAHVISVARHRGAHQRCG